MSLPVEADFALISIESATTPGEFTKLCGFFGAQINRTAGTNDRFRRDCDKPALPGYRRSKTTGRQLDVTSSGAINIPDIALYNEALGVVRSYKVELFQDNETDVGDLIHTITGDFNLTSANTNVDREGEGGGEITLASDGPWIETAAPAAPAA